MKNLVIVESPTKAKTISRFLGDDFVVESSYGHIRDLPKSELGIDVENNYEPRYIIPKKSQKKVTELKKLSQEAEKVILATDEDREGEAIAFHLIKALELGDKKKTERIVFHEITKTAIEKALESPRAIETNLVEAQQTRRILDRLVGYKLSPFLWKKLMRGLSAGRVQSVALRLIAEREKEIEKFKPQNYWTIKAILKNQKNKSWEALLTEINKKPVEKPGLTDKKEVKKTKERLEKSSWNIESIETKDREKSPRPPFTTSTLQQASWQKLKFSAKRTMVLAQQLYEGIEIKKEGGNVGLITYMRTDSVSISEQALVSAQSFLKTKLGEKYSLTKPRIFKTKSKGAQEAHESIRPTDPKKTPESIKSDLTPSQYKLYKLIWERFIASQMPNALFEDTVINTKASQKNNVYGLQSKGSVLKFDGFLKIYPAGIEEKILPKISNKDLVIAKEIKTEDHQTQAPPRYNDASLVKALEKHGIGRPSTYSQIISTIETRNYVKKDETKRFVPSEIGLKVNKMLVDHFPQIVDIDFTAKMEKNLDEIASGDTEVAPIINNFYIPFEKNLKEKYDTVEKIDLTEKTNEICEKCGKPMVIRHGRFGKFIACSGFPDCKNTKQLPPINLGMKCPLCKSGEVIERNTKKGKMFFGCSRWPKCEFATWQKPTGDLCPDCAKPLVELKESIKCSNKVCKYREKKPQKE